MHEELSTLLAEVDRPGDVCAAGNLSLTMPGLEVEGVGAVPLPLVKNQARILIKRARQAPYGKGTQTLVDTTVRRVWELDPEQFRLTNPKWAELIETILVELKQKLGLQNRTLTAHLYKLLIYEKGSFFLPHRDGEKLDRMVATLVVALPSAHEGGALIVSHGDQQHAVSFDGAASGFELSYAAFYADCQHEVTPLESGYRLCLTYNVTLADAPNRKGIAAPSYDGVAKQIGTLLDASREEAKTGKHAVILNHLYTQEGLSLTRLKGVDRAQANVLFQAAEQADYVAHLALVTLWQHGTAEGGDDDSWYDRNHSWYDEGGEYDDFDEDFDDEDDAESAGSGYEMGEVFDSSLVADHWSDSHGRSIPFGEIDLDESELLGIDSLDLHKPSREDFEGYTGNAGMTLERWYHRAAIVIWPREQHLDVLRSAGTDASIAGLLPMVEALRQIPHDRSEASRRECLTFAASIIDSWQPAYTNKFSSSSIEIDRGAFANALYELDDASLIGRFLSEVLAEDDDLCVDEAFAMHCKQGGWTIYAQALSNLMERTTETNAVRNANLLLMLCTRRDKNRERLKLCRKLCERSVAALLAMDSQPSKSVWQTRKMDRPALLDSLVTAMLAVEAQSSLMRLVEHTLNSGEQYDLTNTHLAAIFALETRLVKLTVPNEAINSWLTACRGALEERTAQVPQPPADYRRIAELSCTCDDCMALERFLANPEQAECRMPLNKDRRKHLHQIIDRNGCDLTHVTERQGRPFTLVCTKTTDSYKRAVKVHERDLENLARLVKLQKRLV